MLSRVSTALILVLLGIVAVSAWKTDRRTYRPWPVVPIGLLHHRDERNIQLLLKRSLLLHRDGNPNYSFHIVKEYYGDSSDANTEVCSLLNRGVITMVAITPPGSAIYAHLAEMSSTHHIPLITYGMPKIDKKLTRFILDMKPSTTRATLEMMQYYGWRKVIYVTDNEKESGRFKKLLESGDTPYTITIEAVLVIETSRDAVTALMSLEDSAVAKEELHVVLDTSANLSKETVFRYASHQIRKRTNFLIMEPFAECSWADVLVELSDVTVTMFNLVDPENSEFRSLTRRNTSPTSTLLSMEAGAVLADALNRLGKRNSTFIRDISFNNSRYMSNCLINIPWIHGLPLSLAMKRDVAVEGATGNVQFNIQGQRTNYTVHISEVSSEGHSEIGTWSDRNGLKIQFNLFSVQTPKPPQKKTVTSVLANPYLMRHSKGYIGFCKDLMDLLSNRLKFKHDLKLVDDGRYGHYDNSSGRWNGMIGELLSGRADMILAPLTMTSTRSQVVEFTVPFQNFGITLLLKKFSDEPSLCTLAFRPFSWQLWVFIISVYIILGVLSLFIMHYAASPKHSEYSDISNEHEHRCRSLSLRIALLVCLVFTVLVVSLYIAGLGRILSHQEKRWSNTRRVDVMDVFRKSVLTGIPKMLLLRGGSTMEFFQRSKTPLYRRYWDQVSADPTLLVNSYSDCVQRMLESNDEACLVESTVGDYITNENCNLETAAGNLNARGYAIALRPNDPLRRSLDKAILALRENESLDNLYAKWWRSKCVYGHGKTTMNAGGTPIKLMQLGGFFYVLLAGIVLIAATAVIQVCYQKRKDSVQRNSKTFLIAKESL